MIEACSRAVKFFTILLVLTAMVGLAACGSDGTKSGKVKARLTAAAAAAGRTPPPFSKHAAVRGVPAVQQLPATVAPFFGNLTVVTGPLGNGAGMQRQPDCSLLFADFQYTINTSEVVIDIDTEIPHFEKVLHSNAFLTTTPDVFAKGCVDQTLGHTSRIGEFLGLGKGGVMIAAALADGDVYAGAMDAPNDFYNPKKLGADLPPLSMSAGDFNKDQNLDVVSVNTDGINSSVDVFLGNGDGTFKPPTVMALPAQSEVQFCVVEDMNGDGNLDLVLGVGGGNTYEFLIYLGKGDGTFAAPVAYTPGNTNLIFFEPFIIADTNGDGFPDIITLEQVFLGQKSGTSFTPAAQPFTPVTSATNMYAPGMVATDFNNDGKIDVAIDDGRTIRTYLGNGDGTFNAGPAYAMVANRGLIVAADLDGDGNVDLFSGFGNSGLYGGDDFLANVSYALMGNGDGTFAGAPNLPVQYDGTNMADLNGDGRPDLVTFTVNSNNQGILNTYLTNSSGLPVRDQQLMLPAGQTGGLPVLGKFKGGTTYDAFWVGTTPIGPTFNLAVGNGDGSFQLPITTNPPSLVPAGGLDVQQDILGVQTADMNHDGKADLVYSFFDIDASTNTTYLGVAVQFGNGDGTFQAPVITYTTTSKAAVFDNQQTLLAAVQDVNKDNFPDVFLIVPGAIVNGTEQNAVQLFISNGDGTFKAPATLTLAGNYRTYDDAWGVFAFADLNGDGNVDLVVSGSSTDGTTPMLAVALGNGDGTFKPATVLTTEGFGYPGSPALADFDGDGKLDLAIPGAIEGSGGYFPGNGDGTFQSITNTDGTISPPRAIFLTALGGAAAADFDKDGKQDLIFGSVLFLNKAGEVAPVLATTSTAVTSSLNPSTSGASLTFTAAVTSATAGTITGSVAFFDGATQIGTGTVSAGVATFSTSTLTAASHSITAQYGGDTNFAASTSPVLSQVVTGAGKATTTTELASSLNPSTSGASVTFTAAVTSATAGTITGTVTFLDNGTQIGTGTLTAGVATFSTSALTSGTHPITAQYGGDTNYATSTSTPALSQVVNASTKATTSTTVASSQNPSTNGTSVTFTATVTSATAGTITGTVTFLDGATQLGMGTLAAGVATFSTSSLSAGSHSITAQYGGDANYATSTSTAITQVVNAGGDYSVAATPGMLTVPAGQSGVVALTVTPMNGSTQTVTFGCTGLPALAACSFMPASITLDGTHAAMTQVTISTTAPTAGVRAGNVGEPPRFGRMVAGVAIGFVGIFGMLLIAPRSAVRRVVLIVVALSIPMLAVMSCSGTPGSSGGGGTPAGMYTVSVSATAGADAHTAPVTLTVN